MAGAYVTQSRKVPGSGGPPRIIQSTKLPLPWDPRLRNFGPSASESLSYFPDATQTTTSFRTGRSGSGDDVDEDELLNATSAADRIKLYKKQAGKRGLGKSYDTGHTFNTQTGRIDGINSITVNMNAEGYPCRYVGPIFPYYADIIPGGGLYPALRPLGSTQWYETAAINRTIPTHPVAGLATALGELRRDGLPSLSGSELLKNRTHDLRKSVGSEYLNLEFAWKPLISDLSKTLYAVNQAGAIWRQLERDSGRIVRRSYVFPVETSVATKVDYGGNYTMDWTGQFSGSTELKLQPYAGQNLVQSLTNTREVYLKAGYSYYLPGSDSSPVGKLYGFENKVNSLLGTRLTPEVVWNLAPWSWLADWNANIGDNIANASRLSSDGLVIRWAYLMVKDSTRWDYTLSGVRFNGGPTITESGSSTSVRKVRIQASPFGFGLNPNSFTGRQWAILAALGMTQSPRALRQE